MYFLENIFPLKLLVLQYLFRLLLQYLLNIFSLYVPQNGFPLALPVFEYIFQVFSKIDRAIVGSTVANPGYVNDSLQETCNFPLENYYMFS